jgi:hypothetical protein
MAFPARIRMASAVTVTEHIVSFHDNLSRDQQVTLKRGAAESSTEPAVKRPAGRVDRNAPQLRGHISISSARRTLIELREIRHNLWTISRALRTR